MPSRKRKLVKPKSTDEKKSEEQEVKVVPKDPVKTSPNPVRISIAGLKLQPVNMSTLKILPKGTVINSPLIKSPATPINISSSAKVVPLSATGIKIDQLKVASSFTLNKPQKKIEFVKIEPLEGKKSAKSVVKVNELALNPPKVEKPETSKVIKLESPEARRSGLRGVKIDVNFLLGRKESPSTPKKPQKLPRKILKPEPSQHKPAVLIESLDGTPDGQFPCKKCPLVFEARKDFMNHRKLHKKSNFDCDKCHQTFRFQSSFQHHTCDFWCQICGKTISNKANLKIHMSYVHGIGEAKYFTCDICGRTYKSKRNIDTHMKNHMESTPFNCAICSKGFSHLGALKIHMWNHRDVVDCEYCGKKFKPRSLYYHVKKCTFAQAAFGGEVPRARGFSMKEEHLEEEDMNESEYVIEYINEEDL